MSPRMLDSHYNESERRFSMLALRCPLMGSAASPLFVPACAAASTFHACEGTPASTWKDDALSLRGADSSYSRFCAANILPWESFSILKMPPAVLIGRVSNHMSLQLRNDSKSCFFWCIFFFLSCSSGFLHVSPAPAHQPKGPEDTSRNMFRGRFCLAAPFSTKILSV